MKEMNTELALLLEKYRQGRCTDEEKKRLEAWLEQLEQTEDPLPLPAPETREALRSAFVSRVAPVPKYRTLIVSYKRYIAAAVCVAVCLGAAFFLTRHNNTPTLMASVAWDTLYSKPNEVRSIRLNDNSVIALNANTSIRISRAFGKTDRKVELIDGEAWFDVQKNAQLPFIVQCQKAETRVLGTRFVISAYRELPELAVQVIEGKVSVALPNKKYPLVSKGEAIHLHNVTGESTADNFDRAAFDPINKRAFIRNGSFSELALRIKNTFGYTLIPKTPDVSQRRFTGEFRYNESIQNILQKFSEIHNGGFHIEGEKVFME
ncbi:DUF4974 domain-containing protein [Chitinophaga sp. SYP-B3965]|uniref:FecR family protein n=1 Tax=Chitinophaga sp. SYP-B3965 TaxID=2663120 RepID=UPI001299FA77|nr:FecR family protein [Chitinophaga sp. SYP-B3965]MRG47144.1 DUF4974 domain-containing protein [Chitinophaga sp. SYP-B3965]